ncbi:MAG: hypothetical protein ACTJGQ_05635 [Agrococcus casei]|uniref:hypothetical protein n=1 Tax=Agrococcus casei TaxID=343512 RepID=UPI003F9195EC
MIAKRRARVINAGVMAAAALLVVGCASDPGPFEHGEPADLPAAVTDDLAEGVDASSVRLAGSDNTNSLYVLQKTEDGEKRGCLLVVANDGSDSTMACAPFAGMTAGGGGCSYTLHATVIADDHPDRISEYVEGGCYGDE